MTKVHHIKTKKHAHNFASLTQDMKITKLSTITPKY